MADNHIADNHETVAGRNLVTLGIVALVIGLVMLSTGTDAGRWVAIGGLVAAALGGFTSRLVDGG
jgi:hypothetical protein